MLTLLATLSAHAGSDALYFVLVDRFADGSPDVAGTVDRADPHGWHGGDVQGVIDHVDHLAVQGYGGLWLSPVSEAQTDKIDAWGAYHGYWVEDLGEVEPRLATWEQLRALSDGLHARGMRLYLDMVYNHVGPASPLLRAHPDWFHGRGDVVDWDDPVQAVTHDVHGLPDLAQEVPEVYDHLRAQSVKWIERVQPDGFRVDAVRHLPPGFLKRLGADLRAAAGDDFELLGEVFDGNPDTLAARRSEDALDAVFDFPLFYAMRDVFCDDASPGRLAALLSLDPAPGAGAARVTFLDNHDLPRIRTACHDDEARVQQALAFLLTTRGRPCVTWGTEIGLQGADEPANRGDMVFGRQHPTGDALRSWLAERSRHESFRDGRFRVEALGAEWTVLSRTTDDEATLVAVNRGTQPVDLSVPAALRGARQVGAWVVSDRARPVEKVERVPGKGLVVVVFRPTRPGGFAAEDPPPTVTVQLKVRGLPEVEGSLVAVGAGEALGAWDPAKGARARRSGPVATVAVQGQAGTAIVFKLARVAGDETVWEPRGDRTLLLAEDATAEVSWGE